MRILAITQARTGSSRLPFKVLKRIHDRSLLEIHLSRLKSSKLIDKLVVATTGSSDDDSIVEESRKLGIESFRGDENDVLDRFYQTSLKYPSQYVIRLTSDCPLIDPSLIDEVINRALELDVDYYSNTLIESFPDGQDIEVIKFAALSKSWKEAKKKFEREHVTQYIINHSDFKGQSLFSSGNLESKENNGDIRLTVDEEDDLDVIKALVDNLGFEANWKDYVRTYKRLGLSKYNSKITRNEGLTKSINNEQ